MVVFTVPGAPDVSFGPTVASGLAALGVSRVTLLRDAEGIGVVLEGWAFDEASAVAARAALGIDGDVRTMTLVAEMSVAREPARPYADPRPAPLERGTTDDPITQEREFRVR